MHCFFFFALPLTLSLVSVSAKATAVEMGSLKIREKRGDDADLFGNFEDLSPSSDDSSFWNDEFDLTSVPACDEA